MADKTPEEIAAETAAATKAAETAAAAAKTTQDELDAAIDGEDKLGDAGKRALEEIRAKAKTRQTALEAANAELVKYKEAEAKAAEANKTEEQKREERAVSLATRAETAELNLSKLTIGLARGLTAAQSKRLTGKTEEEIKADAEEMATDFGIAAPGTETKPAVPGRPKMRLVGGSAPQEETDSEDPAELAKKIPRS